MNRIEELKNFVEQSKPEKICFWSINQDEYDVIDPCVLKMRFTNILINESPGIVYLTGGENSLRLNFVNDVEFVDKRSPIGAIVKVHCGFSAGQDHAYTLVIS